MFRRSSAAASFLLLSACADVPTEPIAPDHAQSPTFSVVGLTADQQFNHGMPILNCILTICSSQTGQTFIPNASNLAAVRLVFSNISTLAASANVTVTVRSGDMSGSVLGSTTTLVVMNANASGNAFDFNFSSPIPVTPGLTYAIQVQGASNTIALMGARVGTNGLTVENMYPRGQAVTNGVPAGDTEDYYFFTYADPSFNTPPAVATDVASVSADEGQTATNTGTVSDPQLDAVSLSATVGTAVNNNDGTWSWSLITTDGPESQTVTITADDGNGGSAMTSFELTVANVDPTVDGIAVPLEPVGINQPVSVIASFSDPAGAADEPFECTVDLRDGSRPTPGTVAGFECSVDATYPAPGTYTVTFFLLDKDGGSGSLVSEQDIVIYEHSNSAPELAADLDLVTVNEGQLASNSGTVSDPDLDVVSLSASVGTAVNNNDGTWSWSFATADGPAESQTVTITADDGNGGSATSSFALTVANVDPTVFAIAVPLGPVALSNQPVNVVASFSDPAGAADAAYECTVDLGNGLRPQPGTVVGNQCSVPGLTYAAPGIYTVTFFLLDKDGGSAIRTSEQYIVIYDPNGSFVTGAGWINSAAGAYKPDATLTGKATFGFVSKYVKGKTTPAGTSQFQFHAAGLDFDSDTYEWLVVSQAGTAAQLKGAGTINGALGPNGSPYKFMLWAGDGAPDRFRIRIWTENAGAETVVYDNGFDQTIGGGSIVIHTKGK